MSDSKLPSSLTYIHHRLYESLVNGKKTTVEESVYNGARSGISFKYYSKEGDKAVKYSAIQSGKDFKFITILNGKKEERTMSMADLLKEIKAVAVLEFAHKYLKDAKMVGGRFHARRPRSKKSKKSKSKSKSRR